MTKSQKLSLAQATRNKLADLRRAIGARAGQAPEVDNLLPAIPGDDIKKLQSDRQGADCNVTVENVQVPPGAKPGDTFIALMKDLIPVTEFKEIPIPAPATLNLTLPGTETATPGIFRMRYQTLYASNSVTSDESVFFIDVDAPNHNNPFPEPVTDPTIVGGVVTREILEALDGIPLTSVNPTDVKAGDKLTCYYGKSDPGVAIGTFLVTDDFTRVPTFKVPKSTVILAGQGDFIAYLKAEDRVGNIGPSGAPAKFSIRLTPAPSGLQPPEIPEWEDDGVIYLNDAWPTLAVVIPTFKDGLPGDSVVVTINGVKQPGVSTDGTIAVVVDVPFADIAAGGDGPKQFNVTYEIVRGTDKYPETVGQMVDVNLTIAGPVNPQPDPELGNPNLVKLVVKGSTADNELVEGDVGTVVDIDLTIYDGYKAGDFVNLFWNKILVPPPEGHYAVLGTEDPAFKIPFKLKSEIFEATGNGEFEARYKITNPTNNGSNSNPSPPTPVDVYIFPVDLPDPVIQHLFTNAAGKKYCDCSSLRDIPVIGKAVIVKVAGGGSLADGMDLDFKWIGTPGLPSDPAIPDYLFQKTLQNGEHISGFEVYLPFSAALKPIGDGEGEIIYTTIIGGKTHSSDAHKERVVMIDNNGTFCPGTK